METVQNKLQINFTRIYKVIFYSIAKNNFASIHLPKIKWREGKNLYFRLSEHNKLSERHTKSKQKNFMASVFAVC